MTASSDAPAAIAADTAAKRTNIAPVIPPYIASGENAATIRAVITPAAAPAAIASATARPARNANAVITSNVQPVAHSRIIPPSWET